MKTITLTEEAKLLDKLATTLEDRGYYAIIYGYERQDGTHVALTYHPIVRLPEQWDACVASFRYRRPLAAFHPSLYK